MREQNTNNITQINPYYNNHGWCSFDEYIICLDHQGIHTPAIAENIIGFPLQGETKQGICARATSTTAFGQRSHPTRLLSTRLHTSQLSNQGIDFESVTHTMPSLCVSHRKVVCCVKVWENTNDLCLCCQLMVPSLLHPPTNEALSIHDSSRQPAGMA